MNIWHLPGPSEFLGAVERSLRDGESVILRFPEGSPAGFETALSVQLADCGPLGRVEVNTSSTLSTGEPLCQLMEQFAPELTAISDLTAVDLCEAEGLVGGLSGLRAFRTGAVLLGKRSWRTTHKQAATSQG